MNPQHYPALFRAADAASNAKQFLYLRLIKTEYAFLILAAILYMEIFSAATFYLFYAIIFVASMFALLTRALLKPEQDWYRCRAFAESVKTLTWRYMMCAEPFAGTLALSAARTEFREHLQRLLNENRITAQKIASDTADADQITTEMDRIRSLHLPERKKLYARQRVQEQRTWYSQKASANKTAAKRWVGVGVGAYVVAIVFALSRIKFPDWHIWPIEPVIVFASSVIGWMQLKKFNELGAAYTVAAHEIGLISPTLEDASNDAEFSECVNDAELAFSREHTMWIARQSN